MARRVRSNPSLVGIGRLVELHGQRRDGTAFVIKGGARRWLAWRGDPQTGDLLIVEPHGRAKPGDATTRRNFKTFHAEEPVDWTAVEWHPPRRMVEHVGFAQSVTYHVPNRTPSNKNGYDWIHHFGDFGGGVDERDNQAYWPGLATGPDGSIYIMRRRGNRYALKDWLEG